MIEAPSSTSVLQQFVQRTRGLYSLPQVAVQVLELTSQAEVDVAALKGCLQNDPALVAKILRVVNSSLYGLSREVTSLNQAVGLLGIKPLKLLVLGFSLPKELFHGLEAQVLARYWRRTLVKAVAAKELSERVWNSPGDEAFIAGLLQDVGQLALIQDLGDSYTNFLDRVHAESGDLAALELNSLGFDHAVLGARLMAHWGLPAALVRAVGLPHRAERLLSLPAQERALPQALHLAELVAALVVDGRGGALAELLDAGQQYRGLTLVEVEPLLATLEDKVGQLANVLSLELPAGAGYVDLLARAHVELSSLSEDAAARLSRTEQAADLLVNESRALQASLAAALHKAAADPSTLEPAQQSSGMEPGLVGRVAAAIMSCRVVRHSFSLLLIGLDRYDELILTRGLSGAAELSRWVEGTLRMACDQADSRIAQGDGRFAVLLENRDRPHATAVAREVTRLLTARAGRAAPAGAAEVTLSMGIAALALPPKNFPAHELIDAAQRCLAAAQRSGGDSLKSIDL